MSLKIVHVDDEKWLNATGKAMELIYDYERKCIAMGILAVRPGERLPSTSYSVHEQSDEFAIVIEGELFFGTDREEKLIVQGDIVYNKRGTPHYVQNRATKLAKVIWAVSPPL